MRFQLIDQVTEQQPNRVTAVKAVTAAEEYLADHFPGFPVLPGVLMLEALVQAARTILEQQTAAPGSPAPGSLAPGSLAPGSLAPGSLAPGSLAPGSLAPEIPAGGTFKREIPGKGPWVLVEARNIRYGSMVRPGEQLHVEVALRKQREDGYEFDGVGRVGQSVAVQGRFRLATLAVTD